MRGLWTQHVKASKAAAGKGKGRSNGNAEDGEDDEGQVVIVVTKAERLKSVLGSSWTAFSRLAELVDIPATVVFCSQMPWEDLRPQRGDVPEPVHLYMEPLRRDGGFGSSCMVS